MPDYLVGSDVGTVGTKSVVNPHNQNTQVYKKYYPLFLELYNRNKDLYEKLTEIKTDLQK
jgi:ribosomal protein S17E